MFDTLHEFLLKWDIRSWYYLNAVWRNELLDAVMPYMRNQYFWAPLYLFLVLFMPINFRWKGVLWCLFFLAVFAIADYTSASIIKPAFARVRPCNDVFLSPIAQVIVPCGSGHSFPSSHAANHFGLGIFSALTLGRRFRWVAPLFILWAVIVSYAQVYVGVHFPLDILCGGLLGGTAGWALARIFNRRYDLRKPAGPWRFRAAPGESV